VGLLCVFSLSGCDSLADLFQFKDNANAQQTGLLAGRPVQTVIIRAGTFSIEADTTIDFATNIEVKDEVTIYRQITGRAFFTIENNTTLSIVNLTSDSVIIERPATNVLTLINIDL
jgi:hypothetical protein